MPPNSAAVEAAATALMPLIPAILVWLNSAAVGAVQEDIEEEVDLNEADDEIEQENDKDAGLMWWTKILPMYISSNTMNAR